MGKLLNSRYTIQPIIKAVYQFLNRFENINLQTEKNFFTNLKKKLTMTASTKDEFSTFVLETLKASKQDILDHNPDIVFDVDGHTANLQAKELKYKTEFGKIAGFDAAKIKQIKIVNDLRDDWYDDASATTDSLSGYMGKKNELSVILHQKRESLSNPANRGPRIKTSKDDSATDLTDTETPETDTPSTDTPIA